MLKDKIIIGITGLSGSGKDTVADYLKSQGFVYTSLSDEIRQECARRGLGTDRDNLIEVANELREKFGYDELAKRSLEKISGSKSDKFVIVSLRHPKEVEYLRQRGMKLVAVEASLEARYERNSKRGRPEDFVSFEKFKEQEERERNGSENQQQLDKVIGMTDYTIDNSGTMKELEGQVEEILYKLR